MEQNKKIFIQGITNDGQKFRPSDWAERLCSSVSRYKPLDYSCNNTNYCPIYSPYATPVIFNGIQCAMIDERIKELEPLVFDFLINFAKDNNLTVSEGCYIKEKE